MADGTDRDDGGRPRQRDWAPERQAGPEEVARIEGLGVPAATLLAQMLEQTRMAICITDPHAPDNPIVYANGAFEALTGYPRDDIIGRNCRFLQGRRTDRATVDRLSRATAEERTIAVELLNYRADGTPFWNALHVGPVYDAEGALAFFYGSQWDVTELVTERQSAERRLVISRELNHRIGNLFTMVIAVLRMSGRDGDDAMAAAMNRIVALSRAHRITAGLDGEAAAPVDLREFVEAVLLPHRDEHEGRLRIVGPALDLPAAYVSTFGLLLHELVTNAAKHGALSCEGGRVRVSWEQQGQALAIEWDEAGGPALDGAPTRRGSGARLIDAMTRDGGASLERDWRPEGLRVRITLPLD